MSEFSIEDAMRADYPASQRSCLALKGALSTVNIPPCAEMIRTSTGYYQQEDNPDNSWSVTASIAFDGEGTHQGLYASLGKSVKLALEADKTPSHVELAMLEPHLLSYVDNIQVTRVRESAWLGVAWETLYEADQQRWPNVVTGLMNTTPFTTYEKTVQRGTTNFRTETSYGTLAVGEVSGNTPFVEQTVAQRPEDMRFKASLDIRDSASGARTQYVYADFFGVPPKLRGQHAEQFGEPLHPIGNLDPDVLTEGKVWHFINCLSTALQAIVVQDPNKS